MEKWEVVPQEYQVPVKGIYSYSSVGLGMKGLLVSQTVKENGRDIKSFVATEELIEMFDSDTLLVFDEAHYMKNPGTVRIEACSELVRAAQMRGSKCIYLSATPIDKPQHAVSVFRFLGLTSYRKLYEWDPREKMYEPLGIIEVERAAKKMNPRKFRVLYTPSQCIHRGNITKYSFKLLSEIIFPTIRSGLTSELALENDIKNLFLKMDPERKIKLFNLVSELEAIDRMMRHSKEHKGNNSASGFAYVGKITTILKEIEHAKAYEFIRLIEYVLSFPGTKVAMALWYLQSMDIIGDYFNERGLTPLFLTGSYSMKERRGIIKDFQTPLNEYRLLLLHPIVGGIGIDLHSICDKEWIYGFINSNYSIIPLNQTAGRWNRKGQKTKPVTRYLYIDNEDLKTRIQRELAIINRLADKGGILIKTKGIDDHKYPLPGSLYSEYEKDFFEEVRRRHGS